MGVLLPWTIAMAFQTARDLKTNNRPPVPSEFVASGAAFTVLALISSKEPGLASVLSWGLLLALALQIVPMVPDMFNSHANDQHPTGHIPPPPPK